MELESLLNWSRGQFALTAMYHWLFVPLTLGLGIIMSLAETKYYRSGDAFWKSTAKFWQKIFGINFAIGVATGLILEFQFGTNWSNYSWFVGDIFGAPLAIEGILAFFMEATFIAVMFFGWEKVSKGFHLTSTWLTVGGATISAVWILVANSWMQYPVGMEFNPDTVRSEMADFAAVALSPMAINKFFHTTLSAWVLGAVFAVGVCSWYLLRGRNTEFAIKNIKMIAPFGLIAILLTVFTGDSSAFFVAKSQPMKFAAMEALYESGENTPDNKTLDGKGQSLSLFGVLNPAKKSADDGVQPFLFNIKFPMMLSYLSTRTTDGYVPGINNLLNGGYYLPDGSGMALSAEEKMERGRTAINALNEFIKNKELGNETAMAENRTIITENFPYFGYGYIQDRNQLVPSVPMTYYSFRIMVGLGMLFILTFLLALVFVRKPERYRKLRWFHVLNIVLVPLVYVCSQSGWIVAEVGRQPWTIQDLLPVQAAISKLEASSVVITFFVFLVLFTILLIAEINIMLKAIKHGPMPEPVDATAESK